MRSALRPLAATAVALLMLVGAVVLAWMAITSGVLSPAAAGAAPTTSAAATAEVAVQPVAAAPTAVVSGGFQVSQPRDPFRPLITEDSPVTGQPGVGGTGGTGSGSTSTGIVVTLHEIRDNAGVLRATVIVSGVTYDVGVGETFAGSFKVVSLTASSGVFMYGDNAFELSVGQEILK